MSESTAVCITGIHRAGTSVTSRILNLLGMYLGPEEGLLPDYPDNPTGFWELEAATRINDRLLEAFGGTWQRPPELPAGWEASPSVAPMRREARALLHETFAGRSLWGWKDPRTALTLSFWQRFAPAARYVICIRNPLDVAASLARRNQLPARRSYELWFRHITEAIAATRGRSRMFVCFEDYFDAADRQVERLAGFTGCEVRLSESTFKKALASFLETERWHHRATVVDALDDPDLPVHVKSLYLAMVAATREAGRPEPAWVGSALLAEPLDAVAHDLASEVRHARMWAADATPAAVPVKPPEDADPPADASPPAAAK